MNMKVSIITPCLNSEQTIRQTIESVLGQTYENIEYILMDGGSTDRTVDIIKEYQQISGGRLQYISKKDQGIYDAMNKGILWASGNVIGIINSDDWYEPDTIDQVVRCFSETGADLVYGEIWVIDENGNREYHTLRSLLPPHPSTFVKRETYQKYGMFDTHYRIAADLDMLLRFMVEGVHFAHIDRILANFRKTGISNRQILTCAEESYVIKTKYLPECPGNCLNKEDIKWNYDRARMIYLSRENPQMVREVFREQIHTLEEIVIFGVGDCGKELEMILTACNISVKFFVDNDEHKWGLERHGIPIFSPEILRYDSVHVIVTAMRYREDICNQLQRYANPNLTYSVLEDIRQQTIERLQLVES